MAQGNIVELAKKGDASAIATLMNKSLRPKGVAAQAVRTGNFLEITLHSQRALNQKAMLEIVQKGMKNLQVAAIERVLVRSQTGDTPTWESEFVLNENVSPSPPPSQKLPHKILLYLTLFRLYKSSLLLYLLHSLRVWCFYQNFLR